MSKKMPIANRVGQQAQAARRRSQPHLVRERTQGDFAAKESHV